MPNAFAVVRFVALADGPMAQIAAAERGETPLEKLIGKPH